MTKWLFATLRAAYAGCCACPATAACLVKRQPLLHTAAVDEGEREQGIAHLVEHVTFLGSKKREGLLGTGARCGRQLAVQHSQARKREPWAATSRRSAMSM